MENRRSLNQKIKNRGVSRQAQAVKRKIGCRGLGVRLSVDV